MKNSTPPELISKSWYLLFFAWFLATSGTLISLFFSEVVKLPVCVLCWYQRIALYPLVLILPLALFPFDPKVVRYAGALVVFGWLTALFHVLLIAGFIPKSAQPCVAGIPCSETHLNVFGFLNMAMMSLLTFTALGILLLLSHFQSSRNNHE